MIVDLRITKKKFLTIFLNQEKKSIKKYSATTRSTYSR